MRSPVFSWFQSDGFWMRLRFLWPDPFCLVSRRTEVRDLPAHLLRDIGLEERRYPDWKRDLF